VQQVLARLTAANPLHAAAVVNKWDRQMDATPLHRPCHILHEYGQKFTSLDFHLQWRLEQIFDHYSVSKNFTLPMQQGQKKNMFTIFPTLRLAETEISWLSIEKLNPTNPTYTTQNQSNVK